MAQTMVEAWLEEGEAKGKAEATREAVLRLGQQRFGKPSRKQRASLDAIADLPRLVRIHDALLQVNSWRELLAIE